MQYEFMDFVFEIKFKFERKLNELNDTILEHVKAAEKH